MLRIALGLADGLDNPCVSVEMTGQAVKQHGMPGYVSPLEMELAHGQDFREYAEKQRAQLLKDAELHRRKFGIQANRLQGYLLQALEETLERKMTTDEAAENIRRECASVFRILYERDRRRAIIEQSAQELEALVSAGFRDYVGDILLMYGPPDAISNTEALRMCQPPTNAEIETDVERRMADPRQVAGMQAQLETQFPTASITERDIRHSLRLNSCLELWMNEHLLAGLPDYVIQHIQDGRMDVVILRKKPARPEEKRRRLERIPFHAIHNLLAAGSVEIEQPTPEDPRMLFVRTGNIPGESEFGGICVVRMPDMRHRPGTWGQGLVILLPYALLKRALLTKHRIIHHLLQFAIQTPDLHAMRRRPDRMFPNGTKQPERPEEAGATDEEDENDARPVEDIELEILDESP